MLGRRQMPDEEDVVRPGKVLRVLRAADQEALLRAPPGRLDEQRFERRLPVGRVGAEIGQVGAIMRSTRRDRPMHVGIDMAVERRHAAGAELRSQRVERRAAGVAEHEVEVGKPARADIADRSRRACSRDRVTGVSRS